MVKKLNICLFVLTECINVTDGRTDTAGRPRPRLHSIARKKLAIDFLATEENFALYVVVRMNEGIKYSYV